MLHVVHFEKELEILVGILKDVFGFYLSISGFSFVSACLPDKIADIRIAIGFWGAICATRFG